MENSSNKQDAAVLAAFRGLEIREARERTGWSQTRLAEIAITNQQTVDRIEKGQILNSRAYPAIRAALGLPIDDDNDPSSPDIELYKPVKRRPGVLERRVAEEYDKDYLPLYASPPNEKGILSGYEVVDKIKRGFPVENVKGAYALIVSEGNFPGRAGDILIINPHLPATVENWVFIYRQEHDKKFGSVQYLDTLTDEHWSVGNADWDDGQSAVKSLSRTEWPFAETIVATIYRYR